MFREILFGLQNKRRELRKLATMVFHFNNDKHLIAWRNQAVWLQCMKQTHPQYLHVWLIWVLKSSATVNSFLTRRYLKTHINECERTKTQSVKVTLKIFAHFLWLLWHLLRVYLRNLMFDFKRLCTSEKMLHYYILHAQGNSYTQCPQMV